MQHNSAAAKLIRQMFRQDNHHNMQDKIQVLAAQNAVVTAVLLRNAAFRAVLGAKRPVESRLGRQETRLEAVLGAKRPVQRPS